MYICVLGDRKGHTHLSYRVMYFIENMFEDSAWTQGEHGHFSVHQICSTLPSTWGEKPCVGFDPPFALDVKGGEWHGVWMKRKNGVKEWGEWHGVIVFLMYLSVVVIKHHRGCHQVQRGRLLAIWCWVLSLMATHLIECCPWMATHLMKMMAW